MIYSKEVENMCVVAKGPNHGPAPIPEEGKWIQAKEIKDDKANTQKAIDEQKAKKEDVLRGFAEKNDVIHQLIDLALLQNGMLKGEALDKFLQRSVELIK